jgi:hypothetical protein
LTVRFDDAFGATLGLVRRIFLENFRSSSWEDSSSELEREREIVDVVETLRPLLIVFRLESPADNRASYLAWLNSTTSVSTFDPMSLVSDCATTSSFVK